jgi:hypothetical protein
MTFGIVPASALPLAWNGDREQVITSLTLFFQ